MKQTTAVCLSLSLALVPAIGSAQPYFGIDVGGAHWDIPADEVQDGSVRGELEDGDTTFGLRLGYAFNDRFAIEAAYRDLGEAKATGQSNGSGFFWCAGAIEATTEATTLDLTFVGNVELGAGWSLFGRAGIARWDAEAEFRDSCGTLSGDDDGTEVTYGAGLEYRLSEATSIRGEWQRYPEVFDEYDVDVITAGFQYRF